MASFKLNIARIKGCPPPAKVAQLMEKFALPEDEEFGVLEVNPTEQNLFGRIVRRTQQNVQRLNYQTREVTAEQIEKVNVYPFGVRPSAEVLEVYAGSAAAIEQVGAFLSGCLGLSTVVEEIEIDLTAALDKLMKTVAKFQLKSIRVKDYAANSYMAGPYAPKFLDVSHAQEFLEEYGENAVAASVRFASKTGKANATISRTASFSYSCNDEDQPEIQSVLRKLA